MLRNWGVFCSGIVIAFAVGACDKKERAKDERAAPAVEVAEAAAPEHTEPPALKPIATEDEVKAFVSEWVKAQNGGDFKSYSRLYAKKFQGTKRVGTRATDFGREGWLRDREGMFQKPFTVKAADVHVEFNPGSVIVGFAQSWKSATYQDEGEKRLQLLSEDGALRINREVMVTSEQADAEKVTALGFQQGAIATETATSYALLIPGKVDINWATEHPVYIHDELGERAVSEQALPGKLRQLKESKYEIYDQNGTRCEVKPTGFKISISVSPPYWTLAHWNGQDPAGDGSEKLQPLPKPQRAVELWQMASSSGLRSPAGHPMGLTLGLELQRNPSCPEPVWGRTLTEGLKPHWTVRQATPDELALIKQAAPRHPLAKQEANATPEALERYVKEGPGAKVIESADGESYLFVDLWSQWEDCGGSNVALGWRRQGDRLVPMPGEQPQVANILDARDLNGDGSFEFIDKFSIGVQTKDGVRPLVDHEPQYLGCRC